MKQPIHIIATRQIVELLQMGSHVRTPHGDYLYLPFWFKIIDQEKYILEAIPISNLPIDLVNAIKENRLLYPIIEEDEQ